MGNLCQYKSEHDGFCGGALFEDGQCDNNHCPNFFAKHPQEIRNRHGLKIEKPKSIWKPVSELPEEDCDVILRIYDGKERTVFAKFYKIPYGLFYDNRVGIGENYNIPFDEMSIKEYCTLTDFVKEQFFKLF